MTVQPPGEVQFEQNHLHRAAGRARKADNLVHKHRRWPEQLLDHPERIVTFIVSGS